MSSVAAWLVVTVLVACSAAAAWPASVDPAGFVSHSVPDSAGP